MHKAVKVCVYREQKGRQAVWVMDPVFSTRGNNNRKRLCSGKQWMLSLRLVCANLSSISLSLSLSETPN